jgi:hypothetical protein
MFAKLNGKEKITVRGIMQPMETSIKQSKGSPRTPMKQEMYRIIVQSVQANKIKDVLPLRSKVYYI